jgi:outer membrane translocation and assembly module TamA
MMLFNQELRFPVFGWARGVAFLDAGNVFPRAADISFADLAVGTGVGVRIHSPFALVRVDFGVPLTNRRRQPAGRWYIGLGHAF